MNEQWQSIVNREQELSMMISDPEVIADVDRWRKLMREHSQITPVVEAIGRLDAVERDLVGARELAQGDDPELAEIAREELGELTALREKMDAALRFLLLPKDPNDDKNVVLEIRAAVGGEESALFAAELMRMYIRFADKKRWNVSIAEESETELGGIKEAVMLVQGQGAYSWLKFESGAHRVQRVPETESGGRIHTSACTVAVLPEVEAVEMEVNPSDLRIDVYRSSGKGGQHVNTTDSAVRITHIPTGIVVASQEERSQLQNREKCMRVLRAKLRDAAVESQTKEMSQSRKGQVGSGDRSERIRTYNYPQGRVTDHRIGLTLYTLPAFLTGDCDDMLEALRLEERRKLLEG